MTWCVLLLALAACGSFEDTPATPAKPAVRCTLRVSAKGLYVDGDQKTQREAVALCKQRTAAMVVLEDDAPQDVWKSVETELQRAGVEILIRGTVGDVECADNPLAKGCN